MKNTYFRIGLGRPPPQNILEVRYELTIVLLGFLDVHTCDWFGVLFCIYALVCIFL